MSGYLQRLVHTASRPAATVHPFTGSMFAAAREKAPDSLAAEEFVSAAKPVTPVAGLVPQSGTKPDSPRSPAASMEYRPIAPVSVTRAEARLTTGDSAGVRGEPAVAPAPSAALLAGSELECGEPRTMLERIFTPLLDDVAAEPVVAIPVASASRHDFHATRGPDALQRESEDIQIHIGRIEVTAVQPPAPRAPKSPDRGPSLDAYLKRRAR
jgi:hypothetical protein